MRRYRTKVRTELATVVGRSEAAPVRQIAKVAEETQAVKLTESLPGR